MCSSVVIEGGRLVDGFGLYKRQFPRAIVCLFGLVQPSSAVVAESGYANTPSFLPLVYLQTHKTLVIPSILRILHHVSLSPSPAAFHVPPADVKQQLC